MAKAEMTINLSDSDEVKQALEERGRLVELAEWIVARHTPTKIELEFSYTDEPSDFCTSLCNDRDCEGHCEEVWCCSDCGDVDDDGMLFSWTRWPCAHILQVRLLAGDLVTIPNPDA